MKYVGFVPKTINKQQYKLSFNPLQTELSCRSGAYSSAYTIYRFHNDDNKQATIQVFFYPAPNRIELSQWSLALHIQYVGFVPKTINKQQYKFSFNPLQTELSCRSGAYSSAYTICRFHTDDNKQATVQVFFYSALSRLELSQWTYSSACIYVGLVPTTIKKQQYKFSFVPLYIELNCRSGAYGSAYTVCRFRTDANKQATIQIFFYPAQYRIELSRWSL